MAAIALTVVALTGARTPAGAARAGKRTTFHGHISAGTGQLAHARGAVAVVLASSGSGRGRTVTLTLRCHRGRGQVCLRGRVHGTATAQRRIPDTGAAYEVSASGNVAPLGRVSATGSVTGTGFIRVGRFGLHLRLSGHDSAVSVDALSGRKRGFSSPL